MQVVPMDSAVLGLPGHRERILGIDASHSNICRFDPRHNQAERDNIDKVISNLDDLFRLALVRGESMALSYTPTALLETRFAALSEQS